MGRKANGFSLIEVMVVVAILGIIAALAIPAYMKYLRRSKTLEATMNLRKLFDASVGYYAGQPKTDATGNPLPVTYPLPAGPSPPANSCCGQVGDKCKPAPSNFDDNTWAALNFSVDDPFYYWYQYASAGIATAATFRAYAYGNLDCDAVFSTYMRSGKVSADGTPEGAGGLFIKDDIE